MFLALFGAVTPHAAPPDYGSIAGSIAYSPSTQVVAAGLAGSGESAADAAVQQCRAQGGADDCWAVNWFSRAVGAFARGSNGAYGTGYGWGDTVNVATDFANKYAIETCQDYGGQNCQVIFVKATSAVSSSGTGGALTQPDDPNIFDQFNEWLSACVEGRLPSDPGCADAARDLAGANIDPAGAVTCLIEAAAGPVGLALCLGPKAVAIWLDKFAPLPN
jgi:serine/threonine-protein kinase